MRTTWPSLLLLAACGGDGEAPPSSEPFDLAPVVAPRVAALEAQAPPQGPAPALEQGDAEELEGLLEMATGDNPEFVDLAYAAIREDIGPRAIGHLVGIALDSERDWPPRSAAVAFLAVLDDDRATAQLLDILEGAPEAWLRQHAAWRMVHTSADWAVPRLLKRLKYEQDPETFVWLAVALARFGNYSGLDALRDLAGRDTALANQARSQLDDLAASVQLSPEELYRRWNSIDASTLPQPAPSSALRREVWRLVAAMNDDTIQLRGVDDARFVLCRLGPWAAVELADALADEDFHVRLHTAQVLERMGPRAVGAGPMLLRALNEPLLAPSVAEALGRVGYPGARPALEERAGAATSHELRVAAVRALGRLGLPESLPIVHAAFAPAEPGDLRMAAATALVLLGQGDAAAAWLAAELVGELDAPAAELALETWLVLGAEQARTGFAEALDAWRAVRAAPPGVTPSLEQVAGRRAERAAGLDIAALTG